MTHFVNYQIELCEANGALLDKINELLIPNYGGVSKTTSNTTNSDDSDASTSTKKITMATVKKGVKAAKDDHGMDFIKACIEAVDGDIDQTLAKNISSINPDQYSAFLSALEAGPSDEDEDDHFGDEDDDFGDIDDQGTVSVDDVKAAVKAYAKEHGRDKANGIMK